MRKLISILLALCLTQTSVYAQDIIKLIAVDSLGNRDSIQFGLDDLSTLDIATAFDEINIYEEPLDALDIRIIQRDSLNHHCLLTAHSTSGRIGTPLYYDSNSDLKVDFRPQSGAFGTLYMNFEIIVRSVNHPVQIIADFSKFSGLHGPGAFRDDSAITLLDPDCQSVETIVTGRFRNNDTLFVLHDTINTFVIEFAHIINVPETSVEKVKVFPNPFTSTVNIQSENMAYTEVSDLSGKVLATTNDRTLTLRIWTVGYT